MFITDLPYFMRPGKGLMALFESKVFNSVATNWAVVSGRSSALTFRVQIPLKSKTFDKNCY